MAFPLLSWLIWIPIFGGAALLFLRKETCVLWVRFFSLCLAMFSFGLSCVLLIGFDVTTSEMQWAETIPWIPSFQIFYRLGVDGLSLPLIVLTCFTTILVILASYRSVQNNVADYCATFLIMQGLMCGVFASLDAVLFYSFWEAMLVPMFLIIGRWGGQNRIYATMKFFLYTFFGSVLLLVAILYLQMVAKSTLGAESDGLFNILAFQNLALTMIEQKWIFLAFLIAFAIKVPMWPVHTWLPDAHVEAPAGGSVVLAAILLKMGGYGFLRFILPITPDASQFFASGIIGLSLIAIIYIALVAIVQTDMKKLIAYSSISHMGIVTLGLFTVFSIIKNTENHDVAVASMEGSLVQMISHGFISAALFLCVGVLYDRLHSRLIKDYGGVVNTMPIFAAFFMLFAMANVGLPGTSGFVGEFLVILSAFQAKIWYAVGAATLLILGASYTLWMYKRVIFGSITQPAVATLRDIQGTEICVLLLLAIAILWLGLWPEPLLNILQASTEHLLNQMLHSKL